MEESEGETGTIEATSKRAKYGTASGRVETRQGAYFPKRDFIERQGAALLKESAYLMTDTFSNEICPTT